MHPILVEIGPFAIYSYGVVLAVAFYLSILLATREAKNWGIDSRIILDISLLILISAIVGGKIGHIIFNFPLYLENFQDINLWRAGFIFHGGLFLSVLAVFLYTKKKRISFLSLADFMIPYVALGEAIGRIGCFLNGCCYGEPTKLPWGRRFSLLSPAAYEYGASSLHPTQLYSSLFLFLLFLTLRYIRVHQKIKGETFLSYFLFYSAFRFFIDFLRGDAFDPIFYHLNLSQIIYVGIFIFSSVILMKIRRKNRYNKAQSENII